MKDSDVKMIQLKKVLFKKNLDKKLLTDDVKKYDFIEILGTDKYTTMQISCYIQKLCQYRMNNQK